MGLEISMKQMYKNVSEPVLELTKLVYNHFGKNPMGWTGIDKLTEYAHNEQFVDRVFELYNYLLQKPSLMLDINPSQYYKIIYKFQIASKSLDYTISRITDCYLFLANYAIRCYNYNYYNESHFIETAPFSTDKSMLERVTYLSALLRSFSETLFCDEHTISGEIYSHLKKDDGIVIARKYKWLNAYELRAELKDFLYSAIDIYIAYSHLPEEPNTDIVGNLLTNVRLNDYIQGYYIVIHKADGEQQIIESYDSLDWVIQYFEKYIYILSTNYKVLSIENRLWQKIRCEYYAMKPFLDECGIDWEPVSYDINIKDIQSGNRPIVEANNRLSQLQKEEDIIEQLYIINNPEVHW